MHIHRISFSLDNRNKNTIKCRFIYL
uniref:DNA sequence from clone AEHM-21P16 n=1 Tax=Heliconius melpomene TaxID=34740 RepID=C3PPH4_HELME|nr:unnamed protein product [Heliconius melpomene]